MKDKENLYHMYCKVKDRIQREKQVIQSDQDVHVYGRRNGRFGRSQGCTGLGSAVRMAADGPKEYSGLEDVDAQDLAVGQWHHCRWI